jgi:hypothetical protein
MPTCYIPATPPRSGPRLTERAARMPSNPLPNARRDSTALSVRGDLPHRSFLEDCGRHNSQFRRLYFVLRSGRIMRNASE